MVSHQAEEIPRTQQQYTIPGILHYIQHEWARFEMERAHWEVERAELQVSLVSLALNFYRANPCWKRLLPAFALSALKGNRSCLVTIIVLADVILYAE